MFDCCVSVRVRVQKSSFSCRLRGSAQRDVVSSFVCCCIFGEVFSLQIVRFLLMTRLVMQLLPCPAGPFATDCSCSPQSVPMLGCAPLLDSDCASILLSS